MKNILIFTGLVTSLFLQAQETVILIHFDFDRSAISAEARKKLDSLIDTEKQAGEANMFELSGHCDSMGSIAYNQELSKRRVFEVHNYLLNNGLSKTQFRKIDAFGETKPRAGNGTEEERSMNRRVEISLFKAQGTLAEKIADTSTTIGTNIILKNINFYGGMHTLLPESEPTLQELLESMKKYPALEIRIEGHICCQAGPNDGVDNETGLPNLSFARAKAVRDYLVMNGIEQHRVLYTGFGHSAPLYPYPEKSEEERTLNRRVEIKILKK